MIVYRIEHPKSKNGPWRHTVWVTDNPKDYNEFSNGTTHTSGFQFHPLFQLWGSSFIPPDIKCGCPSIEALKQWFPKTVRQVLHKHGFKLVALSVQSPEVVTENQVVFNRESAILLSMKTLRN
jgi:hypothetical protein